MQRVRKRWKWDSRGLRVTSSSIRKKGTLEAGISIFRVTERRISESGRHARPRRSGASACGHGNTREGTIRICTEEFTIFHHANRARRSRNDSRLSTVGECRTRAATLRYGGVHRKEQGSESPNASQGGPVLSPKSRRRRGASASRSGDVWDDVVVMVFEKRTKRGLRFPFNARALGLFSFIASEKNKYSINAQADSPTTAMAVLAFFGTPRLGASTKTNRSPTGMRRIGFVLQYYRRSFTSFRGPLWRSMGRNTHSYAGTVRRRARQLVFHGASQNQQSDWRTPLHDGHGGHDSGGLLPLFTDLRHRGVIIYE